MILIDYMRAVNKYELIMAVTEVNEVLKGNNANFFYQYRLNYTTLG